MSSTAKVNPDKFYIGIDANAKPLEKLSTKITRKSAKGGLANAMFVQAVVEDLPEFAGLASEIHINFPWGSLLGAVCTGDAIVLRSLKKVLAISGILTITLGIDAERDRAELERLGMPPLDPDHIRKSLVPRYEAAGFHCQNVRELDSSEWSQIESSWARKLGGNDKRRVYRLRFVSK